MPKPFWFKFHFGDWIKNTQHLDRCEEGSYLRLCLQYYARRTALPDDAKRLSAVAKCPPEQWEATREIMLSDFFTLRNGLWIHDHIEQDLKDQVEYCKNQAERAKRGWNTRRQQGCPVNAGSKPDQSKSESKSESVPNTHTQTGKRLHGIPATVEEVIAFGQTLHPKVPESQCRAFWAHYEGQARANENGDTFWVTSGDAVVTNWKVKLPQFTPLKESHAKTNQRPGQQRVSRNTGTANENAADQYRKVGSVVRD